jgi:hypothetical protein
MVIVVLAVFSHLYCSNYCFFALISSYIKLINLHEKRWGNIHLILNKMFSDYLYQVVELQVNQHFMDYLCLQHIALLTNHLMQWLAREHFIAFSHHESFKLSKV